MGNTYYDNIIGYREKFAYNYANKNRKPVYVQSPTILLTFFDENSISDTINEKILDVLSNPVAVKLIECSALPHDSIIDEIKNTLKLFTDNAGSFKTPDKLNVFIAGYAECMHSIDFKKLISDTACICRGVLSCTVVCLVDELNMKNPQDIKVTFDKLQEFASDNRVFVLGRKKLGGNIPGIEEAKKDYVNIICELTFSSNNIPLSYGIYSAGFASMHDLLNAFWSSNLSNSQINTEEQVQVGGKKNNIISEIEQCMATGDDDFTVENLNSVLKNSVGGINLSSDTEIIVKAVYGDSLNVYLENRKKLYDSLIDQKIQEIKKIIYSGSNTAVTNLRAAIQNKYDTLDSSSVIKFGDHEYLGADTESEIEKHIYDSFLFERLENLKIQYIKSLFKATLDITDSYFSGEDEALNTLLEEKKAVAAYNMNFSQTSHKITQAYSGTISVLKQASYIDSLCGSINAALLESDSFTAYFEKQTDNALSYLYDFASPYCVNSSYNIKMSLFLIGDEGFSASIAGCDTSIMTIGNSHNAFDGILNCTHIDFQEYRDFLNV